VQRLSSSIWITEAVVSASPHNFTVSGDGPYTVRVVAIDAAGNESTPSHTRTVTIDQTDPVIDTFQVSPNPYSPPVAVQMHMAATVTEANPFTWEIEVLSGTQVLTSHSGSNAPVEWDWTGNTLSSDDYQARLTVTDAVGFSTSDTLNFRLDKTAPVFTVYQPLPNQQLTWLSSDIFTTSLTTLPLTGTRETVTIGQSPVLTVKVALNRVPPTSVRWCTLNSLIFHQCCPL